MASFNFEDYINAKVSERHTAVNTDEFEAFYNLCGNIKTAFYKDWESRDNSKATLEMQKRAIIGYQKEKDFFKTRISELLKQMGRKDCSFPSWYKDLEDGIYNENWGMAGLAEWFSDEFKESSSAKIIGDRIYFMDKGRMNLRKQTISKERKDQLVKAFLLLTPEERADKSYYETYLLDGTRVTIFCEPMAKKE
ncbi:MAG: ATPase, partial [Clostridia bacterium]|nr:ATPase [Clostridia bacterium]